MGLLSDIRSGKRDGDGLGRSARMVVLCAGLIGGGGLAVNLAGISEKTVLASVLAGARIGSRAGFAFGGTGLAALPGWPVAAIGLLVGLS